MILETLVLQLGMREVVNQDQLKCKQAMHLAELVAILYFQLDRQMLGKVAVCS